LITQNDLLEKMALDEPSNVMKSRRNSLRENFTQVIISNIFVTNPANKRTQIDLLEKNGI
jgi:hypothetical protein